MSGDTSTGTGERMLPENMCNYTYQPNFVPALGKGEIEIPEHVSYRLIQANCAIREQRIDLPGETDLHPCGFINTCVSTYHILSAEDSFETNPYES